MRINALHPLGKFRHYLVCKLPVKPIALSRSRSSKGHHYNSTKDVAYQNEVYTYLMEAAREAGLGDVLPWSQGPVRMEVIFVFKGKNLWEAHERRPDKDNLTKNLLDAISAKSGNSSHHRALLYDDDIVTDTLEYKRFGPENCIWVKLEFYERFLTGSDAAAISSLKEYEEFIREWSVPDFKGRVPPGWLESAPETLSEFQQRTEAQVSLQREFHDSRLDRLRPT